MLEVRNVSVRYGAHTAVDRLSFRLEEGEWLMLTGPNGAGKSTLIEALARGVPYTGSILWQGQDIRSLSPSRLARRIGILAQKNRVGYAYTVEEVVSLGRYAHRSGFLSGRDREGSGQVERALALTGLEALRHASMLELSGGETQRVFLAQVIAQDPSLMVLDEPANHLDLKYQQQIFSLIGRWLELPGHAVLSVVHDLSLARRYGTRALLMDCGKTVSQGPPDRVLSAENLQAVYGTDVYAWMRELLSQWQAPQDRGGGLSP